MGISLAETGKSRAARLSFGLFEMDPVSGELWKAGFRVKLQGQPFKVLLALIERPGEVVSRDELQLLVWGRDTTVDFDHSLGTAINKIREALGDSADNPRFVETLSRRGYRFIAPVTVAEMPAVAVVPEERDSRELARVGVAAAGPVAVAGVGEVPGVTLEAGVEARAGGGVGGLLEPKGAVPGWAYVAGWAALALVVGAGAGLAGGWQMAEPGAAAPHRIEQVTRSGRISPGALNPNMENLPVLATDGVSLYASVIEDGRPRLSSVSVHTGLIEGLKIPDEIGSPAIEDISGDGSKLLLRSHLSPESEQPVWVVPTIGGSALRVGDVLAHDAVWMPDGESILYASGNQLSVVRLADGSSTKFAEVPGRAFWMRWSPDGRRLRFTVMDPLDHSSRLWELTMADRSPRALLPRWTGTDGECCGVWTAEGMRYVFQSTKDGSSDLWETEGRSMAHPTRLTNGPLSFGYPVAARNGQRIFFLGLDPQSETQRFDVAKRSLVPEQSFLAHANRVDFSRDRQWVTWTDARGRLFRARAADGSETLQLTPDSLQVFLARWSPDGSRLALMARAPGKAWQLYMVGADGGTPERLLDERRNEADPSWSADGRQIVFGRVPDLMGKEGTSHDLQVLEVATRKVTPVPASEGMFSPRWSPDGRWIFALSTDQRRLMLFDTAGQTWKLLAQTSGADPLWDVSSKAVYVHAVAAPTQPIYRVSVPDGALTTVLSLTDFREGEVADYFFVGVTPAGMPLVQVRSSTGNLYSMALGK